MTRKEPQTFEVAEYSDVDFGIAEAHKVIRQIFSDLVRDCPAHAVWGDFTDGHLKIHYLTYTMYLPGRVQQVEEEANEIFKQTVTHLKKEFKSRTGKALKLSEEKDLGNSTVEKVSLNSRYTYRAWKFYGVSF